MKSTTTTFLNYIPTFFYIFPHISHISPHFRWWILAGSTSSIIKEPPAAGSAETAETAETTAAGEAGEAGEAAELPAAEGKEARKIVGFSKKE